MPATETYNEQQSRNAPAILELLSELEARDKDSKGTVETRPGTFGNPRGYKVLNNTGNEVGKVEDVYVDPHTREPFFALLSLGNHVLGIGNRRVLVAFSDIEVTSEQHVRVHTAIV